MIKLLVLDVDGVLTRGDIVFDSHGNELKAFNVKDGLGIGLAKKANVKIAIITGRESAPVTRRAKELKVDHLHQGIHNKIETLDLLIEQLNIDYKEVAYMGDDLNDLAVIKKVGFSGTPYNGVNQVKEAVHFISNFNGGEGAVREFIEEILVKKNEVSDILSLFETRTHNIQ
ncbi:KdsC family phosphatase [Mesobacillus thioparans]|uniref:KdsC family phosphatase n=1 Tax=Mesobacillus thioparans TaxID=370439 RepID=UPI0039EFCE23